MGADLYLNSLYQPNVEKWQKPFDDAIAVRNRLAPDTPEYDRADAKVTECWEQMYSAGYFRDSYNSSNLLWQFGLSWWTDVAQLCTKDGDLTPLGAESLLDLLLEREDVFLDNLSTLESQQDALDFQEQYADLKAFLDQAIVLDEPIRCSL